MYNCKKKQHIHVCVVVTVTHKNFTEWVNTLNGTIIVDHCITCWILHPLRGNVHTNINLAAWPWMEDIQQYSKTTLWAYIPGASWLAEEESLPQCICGICVSLWSYKLNSGSCQGLPRLKVNSNISINQEP